MCIYIFTRAHVNKYAYVMYILKIYTLHTHTHSHIDTHTSKHTHTHKHTNTNTHSDTHTHTHTHMTKIMDEQTRMNIHLPSFLAIFLKVHETLWDITVTYPWSGIHRRGDPRSEGQPHVDGSMVRHVPWSKDGWFQSHPYNDDYRDGF